MSILWADETSPPWANTIPHDSWSEYINNIWYSLWKSLATWQMIASSWTAIELTCEVLRAQTQISWFVVDAGASVEAWRPQALIHVPASACLSHQCRAFPTPVRRQSIFHEIWSYKRGRTLCLWLHLVLNMLSTTEQQSTTIIKFD